MYTATYHSTCDKMWDRPAVTAVLLFKQANSKMAFILLAPPGGQTM